MASASEGSALRMTMSMRIQGYFCKRRSLIQARSRPLTADLPLDPIAGPSVGGEHRVQARSRLRRVGLAGGADQTGNVAEFDLFVEECGDRYLVRGVQDRRLGAPATQRVVSERDARKLLGVRREEFELAEQGQVERGKLRRTAFGVGQRVLNRVAHVRDAQLRDRKSVYQFDHRMNDRLRVH